MSDRDRRERGTHPWIERAYADTLTRSLFSIKNAALYAISVSILAGYGRAQQVSDAIYWGFALVLATLGWLVVGLVINLLAAPYRIANEGRVAAENALAQIGGPSRVVLASPATITAGSYKTWLPGFAGQPGHEAQVADRWRFVVAQRDDGIHLECRRWGQAVPEDAECWVEDPDGNRCQGDLRRTPDSTARCTYPGDFGVDPVPGPHYVHWSCLFATGESGEMRRRSMHDPLPFTIQIQREPR